MAEEWGCWMEHDGSGMPVCEGTCVEIAYPSGNRYVVSAEDGPWWRGGGYRRWKGQRTHWEAIVAYRLRRSPAVQLLIALVENLPVREFEDA